MLTWIDAKSVLGLRGGSIKAGEPVPAGVLSPSRIAKLVKQGKIRDGEVEKTKPEKKITVFGREFEAKPTPKVEAPKVEDEKPEPKRKPKKEKENAKSTGEQSSND